MSVRDPLLGTGSSGDWLSHVYWAGGWVWTGPSAAAGGWNTYKGPHHTAAWLPYSTVAWVPQWGSQETGSESYWFLKSWAQKTAQHPFHCILLVKQWLCQVKQNATLNARSVRKPGAMFSNLLHLLEKQIIQFHPRLSESVFLRLESGNLFLISTPNFS